LGAVSAITLILHFCSCKNNMARPPLPDSERRTEVLQLRLTKGERKDLDEGAEATGEQVSEFIRTAALDKAKRVKKRKGDDPHTGNA